MLTYPITGYTHNFKMGSLLSFNAAGDASQISWGSGL